MTTPEKKRAQKKGRPKPSLSWFVERLDLDGRHIRRLGTFRSLQYVELNLRPPRQGTEAALILDRGEVNENVLSLVSRDESEALCIIEPLHSTGATHLLNLLFLCFCVATAEIQKRHCFINLYRASHER